MIQGTFEEESAECREFVEKFKPKKTTDDCYTPEDVYKVVLNWAARRYGFDPGAAVRPFWPGGDYERFDYPDGCVVVDNPPFSILAKICRWYCARGVRFFLFGPSNTAISVLRNSNVALVYSESKIVYHNGAVVNTSFFTNIDHVRRVTVSPELHEIIDRAQNKKIARADSSKSISYPDEILTFKSLSALLRHGVAFDVGYNESCWVDRCGNVQLFGGGVLMNKEKAKECAEKIASATALAKEERKIEITDREKQLQKMLGEK